MAAKLWNCCLKIYFFNVKSHAVFGPYFITGTLPTSVISTYLVFGRYNSQLYPTIYLFSWLYSSGTVLRYYYIFIIFSIFIIFILGTRRPKRPPTPSSSSTISTLMPSLFAASASITRSGKKLYFPIFVYRIFWPDQRPTVQIQYSSINFNFQCCLENLIHFCLEPRHRVTGANIRLSIIFCLENLIHFWPDPRPSVQIFVY
jgi:hypothetical protein